MPDESTSSDASTVIPVIVVAGDVCIDWLSIVVDPVAAGVPPPMNWQLAGGRHMYARPGGAWLTANFVKAAVGDSARVLKPEGEPELASVPPEKIIHSMLMLDRRPRERNREKVMFWAVSKFEGYAGPPPGEQPVIKTVENDEKDATIVLLDDAGNGFRDEADAWPAALNKDSKPLVVYKVRRPLMKGKLWERLKDSHLERTIALLSADELRGEGATVSRRLSWERTATDLVVSVARDPKFVGLRKCPFLIVPLGVEGVVLMRCDREAQVVHSHLWYEPDLIEAELLGTPKGDMSGFGSAFAATVVASLIKDGLHSLSDYDATERALHGGIIQGLHVQRHLLDEAFGPCERDKKRQPPDYPSEEIFAKPVDRNPFVCVSLPDLPRASDAGKMADYRSWRILETKRKKVFEELAADVVRQGVKGVLDEIPVGRFGKLVTIDRSEMESYRSIRNLIQEFLKNPNPERPLCLAVFGPPGGGKSFGVTQVALDVAGEGQIEKLDFNVSQWDKPDYLVHALHRVRDHALRGKVPLVFFDEFDAPLDGNLGWLKYFLAPMQDGVFADGLLTHQVGKAIFVFAGGIFFTFADFRKEIMSEHVVPDGNHRGAGDSADKDVAKAQTSRTSTEPRSEQIDNMKAAKAPDFLSRLRGNVDVFGLDPPVGTNLIRRALVLRSNLEKKFPKLKDSLDAIHIDDGVLRAFLRVTRYEHGARSLEAILEMSNLVGRTHFDPSMLPPRQQLNLHVDGSAFMGLVEHHQTLGAKLEDIAKAIHELYLKEEVAKGVEMESKSKPAMRKWENLDDLYKNSNREQAAYYPYLLRAVGCDFERDEDGSKPRVEFSSSEIDRLAQMEHDRWVEERRIKQPDHPDLCLWTDLPKEEKDKDIRSVEAIPEILSKVGLRVVRLSEGFRDRSRAPDRESPREEKSKGTAA